MSTLLSNPGPVPISPAGDSFAASSFASSAGSSSRTPRKRKQARLINPARALDFSARSNRSHHVSPVASPRRESFLHDTSNNSLCLDSPFESSRLFKALSSPPTISLEMGLSHPRPAKDQVSADDSTEFSRPTPRREASLPERDFETTTPSASPSRWSKLLHKPNLDLPPAPTTHGTNHDGEPSTSTFLNMIKSTFRKEDTLQLAELSEWQDEESVQPPPPPPQKAAASSPLPLKWLSKRRPLSGSSPKTFASSLEDSPMFSLGTADRYSEIKSRKPKSESLDGFQTVSLSDVPPFDEHEAQETFRDEVTTTAGDETELPSSRLTKGELAIRSAKLTSVSFHTEVVYKVIERLPEFAKSTGPATEKIGDTGIIPLSDRTCIPDDPSWCGDHADDLSPVEEGECKEWVLRQGWTTLSNTYHNEFIDKDLPSENGYVEPFIEMLQAGSFDDEPWRPEVAVEDGRIVVKEPDSTNIDKEGTGSAATSEGTQETEGVEETRAASPSDRTLEKKPSTTDIRVIAECFPAPPGGAFDIRRSTSKSPPSSRRTSLASVAELLEEPVDIRTSRRRSPLSSTNPTIAALAPQAQTLFDTQNRLNEDLSRELEGYSALLSQLESKLSDRDSVIKRLVRDHAQERRRLKKEVADRDAQVERLNAETERLHEQPQEPSVRSEPGDSSAVAELQEQLDAATSKLSSLELQHQDLEAEHDDATAELEHTRQKLADTNNALEKASEDLYAARDAIDSSEHRILQIEEQRDQLHAQVERERNARLEAEQKWEQELASLRKELEEERAARRRAEEAQAASEPTQPSHARSQSRAIPGSSVNGTDLGHSRSQSRELLGFSPPSGLGHSSKRGSGNFLRDSWASATGKRVLAPAAPQQKSAERTIAQLERTVEELANANERLSLGMSSLQQERELLRRKLARAEQGHPPRRQSLRH
ncbi:hypothetical protein A1Q2_01464 [Trichosporon asahii var. asahii CBS 8904]|uniref:Uncharacterized protein n=1 Tax=Trichosporon asahii var. asahii (strain CBS 8904) TaxID=1220162 RepID=K1VJG1_TRIAC|nr:hypothetical protein A1Q2_01464 [Trichosporon asahii var. asahii CBS 8904]